MKTIPCFFSFALVCCYSTPSSALDAFDKRVYAPIEVTKMVTRVANSQGLSDEAKNQVLASRKTLGEFFQALQKGKDFWPFLTTDAKKEYKTKSSIARTLGLEEEEVILSIEILEFHITGDLTQIEVRYLLNTIQTDQRFGTEQNTTMTKRDGLWKISRFHRN